MLPPLLPLLLPLHWTAASPCAGVGAERINFDHRTGEIQIVDQRYWQRPEVGGWAGRGGWAIGWSLSAGGTITYRVQLNPNTPLEHEMLGNTQAAPVLLLTIQC